MGTPQRKGFFLFFSTMIFSIIIIIFCYIIIYHYYSVYIIIITIIIIVILLSAISSKRNLEPQNWVPQTPSPSLKQISGHATWVEWLCSCPVHSFTFLAHPLDL